jgi:hypothetical protein
MSSVVVEALPRPFQIIIISRSHKRREKHDTLLSALRPNIPLDVRQPSTLYDIVDSK